MYIINHRLDKLFWLFCFLVMSAYILYEHATSCLAVDLHTMMVRHQNLIDSRSEFFNPWQYRVFSVYLLEGIVQITNMLSPAKNDITPYLLLRFIQNVILFYVVYYYYRALKIENPVILFIGLTLLCFTISNSVFQSDLSFNTYFDIIFYVLAGFAIITDRYLWIFPITLLAALNRETSGFIPLMLVVAFPVSSHEKSSRKRWIIAGVSLLIYLLIFITLRVAYGYPDARGIHGIKSPLDYLTFNLTFFRMYPQLFGTLALVPIIALIRLNRLPKILKNWFWLIVPFWFVIHLVKSTAVETRLFLVPMALIFVPAVLYLAEQYYKPQVQLEKKE